MDWSLRLKVAIGAARGLEYLHSSSSVRTPIVHRDFKSTNILLDSNYEAKVYQLCSLLISVYDPKCFLEASLSDLRVFSQISDFGLAKLMPDGHETYVTARVLGTFGYFDPEYTSV